MISFPGVSLLICTRDRAGSLVRCLEAAARAFAATGTPAELVLVDNGSTDNTRLVAEAWRSGVDLPFTIIEESLPGLARARNAGLRWTRHSIIAMTDDDCELRPDYISQVAKCFVDNPTPRVIGGRVELGDPRDLPITIKTDDEPRTYLSGSRPGGFIMGANLVLHRAVIDRVGPFDERFGAGARFKAAEDTDYLLRTDFGGFPIEYVPNLIVDHFHGRRQVSDAIKLSENYYFGDGALYAKHLLNGRLSERMMRAAINNAIHEAFRQPSNHPILGSHEHRFKLKHLARGFAAFLRAKAFGAG